MSKRPLRRRAYADDAGAADALGDADVVVAAGE